MVFNLLIAMHKLRAFQYCGGFPPPSVRSTLLVRTGAGQVPRDVALKTDGTYSVVSVWSIQLNRMTPSHFYNTFPLEAEVIIGLFQGHIHQTSTRKFG